MDEIVVMESIGIFGLDMDRSGLTGIHTHEAGLDRF